MEILHLSVNKISHVSPKILNLKNLIELNLAGNHLQDSSIQLPISLRRLDLSQNQFTEVPECFGGLTNLEKLDLSENFIHSGIENLRNLSKLNLLQLACNSLHSLPEEFHQWYPNMRLLSLAYNHLTSLKLETFAGIGLEISGNAFDAEFQSKLMNLATSKINFCYEQPDKIMDNLYLGCWQCARNRYALLDLGITHILTVANFNPPWPEDFTYKIVPVDDADQEQLIDYFPDCIEFINNARSKGEGVLVHW
jgi:Leucine-rich repeat (LRR) protein